MLLRPNARRRLPCKGAYFNDGTNPQTESLTATLPGLSFAGATLCGWMRHVTLNASWSLFSLNNGTTNQGIFGGSNFAVGNPGGIGPFNGAIFTTAATITAGQWVFAAITISTGANQTIGYVRQQGGAMSTLVLTAGTGSGPFTTSIGNDGSFADGCADAIYAGITAYSRALSAAEVFAQSRQLAPITSYGLVSYLPMRSAGTVAADELRPQRVWTKAGAAFQDGNRAPPVPEVTHAKTLFFLSSGVMLLPALPRDDDRPPAPARSRSAFRVSPDDAQGAWNVGKFAPIRYRYASPVGLGGWLLFGDDLAIGSTSASQQEEAVYRRGRVQVLPVDDTVWPALSTAPATTIGNLEQDARAPGGLRRRPTQDDTPSALMLRALSLDEGAPRPAVRPASRGIDEGPAWSLTQPPPQPLEGLNLDHPWPPARRSSPRREDDGAAFSLTRPPPQPIEGLADAPPWHHPARRPVQPPDEQPVTIAARALPLLEDARRPPVRGSLRPIEEGPAWSLTQPPPQPLEGLSLDHPYPPSRRASPRREDDGAAWNQTSIPPPQPLEGLNLDHAWPARRLSSPRREDDPSPWNVTRPPPQPIEGLVDAPPWMHAVPRRPVTDEQPVTIPARALAYAEEARLPAKRSPFRPHEDGPAWSTTQPPAQPLEGLTLDHPYPPSRRASPRREDDPSPWRATQVPAQPLEGLSLDHPWPPSRRASPRREDDGAAFSRTVPATFTFQGLTLEHPTPPSRRASPRREDDPAAWNAVTPPASRPFGGLDDSFRWARPRPQGRPEGDGPAWTTTTPPAQPLEGLTLEHPVPPQRRASPRREDDGAAFNITTPRLPSVGPFDAPPWAPQLRTARRPQDEQPVTIPPPPRASVFDDPQLRRITARPQWRPEGDGPAWVTVTPPPQPLEGLQLELERHPWRRPNRGADEAPLFRPFAPAVVLSSVGSLGDIPPPARIPRVSPQDAQAYDPAGTLPLISPLGEDPRPARLPARRVDDSAPPFSATTRTTPPIVWEDGTHRRRAPAPRGNADDTTLSSPPPRAIFEPDAIRAPVPRPRPPAALDDPSTPRRAALAPPLFDVEAAQRRGPALRGPNEDAPANIIPLRSVPFEVESLQRRAVPRRVSVDDAPATHVTLAPFTFDAEPIQHRAPTRQAPPDDAPARVTRLASLQSPDEPRLAPQRAPRARHDDALLAPAQKLRAVQTPEDPGPLTRAWRWLRGVLGVDELPPPLIRPVQTTIRGTVRSEAMLAGAVRSAAPLTATVQTEALLSAAIQSEPPISATTRSSGLIRGTVTSSQG